MNLESYGDLTELNKTKGILYHVGKETLNTIAKSYLDLLDTSSAIYETDGSYASALFSSSYCNFMDKTSRGLCRTEDNTKALDSGKWLCHESCWTDCSRIAVETGEPFDLRGCKGGINIYAVPIKTEGKIIGAINIGYGTPPKEEEKLQEIAKDYSADIMKIKEVADHYASPPEFVVEAAKRNLHLAAELIGEIYSRKKIEDELRSHRDHLEQLVAERTAELEKTHEQLLHSEKLSALGKLTGSIAHEFNNPIYGLRSIVEQTLDEVTLSQEIKGLLGLALRECDRMSGFVRKLQGFYKPSIAAKTQVDVHQALDDIEMLIKKQLKIKNIELNKNYAPNLPKVQVIEDQIRQVFLNLLNNAAEAFHGENGEVSVTTESAGDHIKIHIKDTGEGIPEKNMKHIFEPFFSTKGVKGTGLGLSLCYGIVKAHGGTIEVDSKPGEGSTFTLSLPIGDIK